MLFYVFWLWSIPRVRLISVLRSHHKSMSTKQNTIKREKRSSSVLLSTLSSAQGWRLEIRWQNGCSGFSPFPVEGRPAGQIIVSKSSIAMPLRRATIEMRHTEQDSRRCRGQGLECRRKKKFHVFLFSILMTCYPLTCRWYLKWKKHLETFGNIAMGEWLHLSRPWRELGSVWNSNKIRPLFQTRKSPSFVKSSHFGVEDWYLSGLRWQI